MGKRIEDLKVDDTPIADDRDEAAARHKRDISDDRDQPWHQFVSAIDDLLATGKYDWAFDSLDGMKQTVEHTRRVTEGQQRAVANIERSGRDDVSPWRRYDGFRREGR